tara:strand:- start:4648 stop:5037 length:390 start_codon:yes stop_codon:yes gene_type:complete
MALKEADDIIFGNREEGRLLHMSELDDNYDVQDHFEDNNREAVLDAAKKLICGDRSKAYGPAYDMYERIASGWSVILGAPVTKEQVGMMMVWMKISRLINTPGHSDSWIDVAGYAALTAEISKCGRVGR